MVLYKDMQEEALMPKRKTSIILLIIILYITSSCYYIYALDEGKTVQKDETSLLREQIEQLNQRITQLENEGNQNIDKDTFDRLTTQKDVVYERVLDGVRAQAEWSNNLTNIILAAFGLIAAIIGVWGVRINILSGRKLKEMIKASDKTNKIFEKVSNDTKSTEKMHNDVSKLLTEVTEKYNTLVEKLNGAEQISVSISEVSGYAEAMVENIGAVLEKAENMSAEIQMASFNANDTMENLQDIKNQVESVLVESKEKLVSYSEILNKTINEFKAIISRLDSQKINKEILNEISIALENVDLSTSEISATSVDTNDEIIENTKRDVSKMLEELNEDDSFLKEGEDNE